MESEWNEVAEEFEKNITTYLSYVDLVVTSRSVFVFSKIICIYGLKFDYIKILIK